MPSVAGVLASDLPRALLAISALSVLTMVVQYLVPAAAPHLLIGASHWYLVPVAVGLAVFSLGLTMVVAGWLSVATLLVSKVVGRPQP